VMEIIMFSGLMSRWTRFIEWMYCRPLAICKRTSWSEGRAPLYFLRSLSGKKHWSRDAAHSSRT
jgi:hypothetical protein